MLLSSSLQKKRKMKKQILLTHPRFSSVVGLSVVSPLRGSASAATHCPSGAMKPGMISAANWARAAIIAAASAASFFFFASARSLASRSSLAYSSSLLSSSSVVSAPRDGLESGERCEGLDGDDGALLLALESPSSLSLESDDELESELEHNNHYKNTLNE